MNEWFYHPESDFHLYGPAHVVTLFIIFLLVMTLYVFRKPLRSHRKVIRVSVGWALIISRLSLDAWYVMTNHWTVSQSLPLHLCSLSSIMCGLMLLLKNRQLFEVFYFLAVGGAMQAILTPNLSVGFPQYRYLQFFLAHFLIFIAPLVLVWLYGFGITFRSLAKSFAALNGLALVMYFIDLWLSANYMFLLHKPRSASLLDFLGPHPYYLLSLEGVVLVIYGLLYLPFALKRRFGKGGTAS